MKRYIRYSCFVFLLALAGCGSKSSSNNVPSTTNPLGGSTTDITVGTTTQNPNIPALYYQGVAIDLTDEVNYSGLKAIAGNVVIPVVGDPKIAMALTDSQSSGLAGQILIAFEDQLGFWAVEQSLFETASTYDGQNLDLITSDNDMMFHVIGTVNANVLTGTLYYKIRQSGDESCLPVTVTCVGGTEGCGTLPTDNPVPACQADVAVGASGVTSLGTFTESNFSDWLTIE